MTPDEIKAKSAALAELYTARANGKTLQYQITLVGDHQWINHVDGSGPDLASDLSRWRVKPEPQRIWISGTAWTDSPVIAAALRGQGQEAREFVEVIP